MWPPSSTCKDLGRFHRRLRIGWDGEAQAFGLIQLFHKYDAERTHREPWEHGPIFSRSGRATRDWDPLVYFPFYLAELSPRGRYPMRDDWGRIETDRFGDPVHYDPLTHGWGYLMKLVKRWARPIASRVYESKIQKGREIERYISDLSFDMAERLYRGGQRDGAGAPIVAKKHATKSRNLLRYEAGELDFTERSLPPTPPGGWDAHFAKDRTGNTDPDNLGSL